MKTLIDVENEGLMSFIGKPITVYCAAYIYYGTLSGVNDECIKLDDAKIVYDTGSHNTDKFADVEPLPGVWYLQKSAIEGFGEFKSA